MYSFQVKRANRQADKHENCNLTSTIHWARVKKISTEAQSECLWMHIFLENLIKIHQLKDVSPVGGADVMSSLDML